MAGNEYYPVRPKSHLTDDGVPERRKVLAGSSLAVQGIFLEALREYFSLEDAPYRWNTDANTSEIQIELSRNPQTEVRNAARAIYVTRMNSVPQSFGIGNLIGARLHSGQESYAAHMGMAMRIECVANGPGSGDCELLSDYVFGFLIAAGSVMERVYGFHKLSFPQLGEIVPYPADTTKFMGPIDLTAQHQMMWTSKRIAPLLEQMQISILARTGRSPQRGAPGWDAEQAAFEAFTQVAVESLDRSVPHPPDKLPAPDRT